MEGEKADKILCGQHLGILVLSAEVTCEARFGTVVKLLNLELGDPEFNSQYYLCPGNPRQSRFVLLTSAE